MKIERWIFTSLDLKTPRLCTAKDEFIAWNNKLPEMGVCVQRNKKITNRYGDGVTGVTKEHIEIAAAEEQLYSFQHKDIADIWRDVYTNEHGEFCGFVNV